MSHFPVLVALKENEVGSLDKALQPFHEYECTGINDEYVVFVDEHDDVKKEWEENKDGEQDEYDCIESYAKEYHGYEVEGGRIGRRTNPNRQWDWWVVGGRWSKFLKLSSGVYDDSSVKSGVDFNGKKEDAKDSAAKTYDEVMLVTGGQSWVSWDRAREEVKDIGAARDLYNGQQVIKDLRTKFDNPFTKLDEFLSDRQSYIESKGMESIATFATLIGGVWEERGDMGWFGCVGDEKEDWPTKFQSILDSIPEDHYLVVVDCHI
jgi:hypothetical protein